MGRRLIRSPPALSPSPLGFYDLCRDFPSALHSFVGEHVTCDEEVAAAHARAAVKTRITFRDSSHGTEICLFVGRGGSAGVRGAARHGGGTRDRGDPGPPSGTIRPERCVGEPERG